MFWHVLMSVTASILLVHLLSPTSCLLPPASCPLPPCYQWESEVVPGDQEVGLVTVLVSPHHMHIISSHHPHQFTTLQGNWGRGQTVGHRHQHFQHLWGKNAGKKPFMYLKCANVILRNTKINASLLFQRIFFPTLFPPSWDGEYDISPRLECSPSLSGARALYLII